jgi:hypothetical protein
MPSVTRIPQGIEKKSCICGLHTQKSALEDGRHDQSTPPSRVHARRRRPPTPRCPADGGSATSQYPRPATSRGSRPTSGGSRRAISTDGGGPTGAEIPGRNFGTRGPASADGAPDVALGAGLGRGARPAADVVDVALGLRKLGALARLRGFPPTRGGDDADRTGHRSILREGTAPRQRVDILPHLRTHSFAVRGSGRTHASKHVRRDKIASRHSLGSV